MTETKNDWPAAAVAIAILALVGSVTISAIANHSIAEALQIWEPLSGVLALFTGAFITFFFTRSTVQAAQLQARNAMAMATEAHRRADTAQLELAKATALFTPEQLRSFHGDQAGRSTRSPIDDLPNENGSG